MKKGIGDKVLGWFVVQEDSEPNADTQTDAEALADEHVPPPDQRRVPPRAPASAPVVAPGSMHDARAFGAVYRAAGVADEERDRLSKVLSLLESLPAEASIDVKRAIVGASLEAFGVSIERILVTGEGALSALDGYVVDGQSRTREVLTQAESRIGTLTSEIEEVRRLMDVQVAAQQELSRAATSEKARVQTVVDFFGTGSQRRAATAPPRLVRLK